MQFLCAINKAASLNLWRQNAKWPKPITVSTVTKPKYVQILIFLHIPRAHELGKYAYVGLFVKCALGKGSCVSKIPPVLPDKQWINVFVFLSTLQLTALLWEKISASASIVTPYGFPKPGWHGLCWRKSAQTHVISAQSWFFPQKSTPTRFFLSQKVRLLVFFSTKSTLTPLMIISFITFKSSLVPLIEGLCSSSTCLFEFKFPGF